MSLSLGCINGFLKRKKVFFARQEKKMEPYIATLVVSLLQLVLLVVALYVVLTSSRVGGGNMMDPLRLLRLQLDEAYRSDPRVRSDYHKRKLHALDNPVAPPSSKLMRLHTSLLRFLHPPLRGGKRAHDGPYDNMRKLPRR